MGRTDPPLLTGQTLGMHSEKVVLKKQLPLSIFGNRKHSWKIKGIHTLTINNNESYNNRESGFIKYDDGTEMVQILKILRGCTNIDG